MAPGIGRFGKVLRFLEAHRGRLHQSFVTELRRVAPQFSIKVKIPTPLLIAAAELIE